jgi:tetratricopeptide (TPR) repeat protein
MDRGRYAEATGCFREALRLNPNYANAHNNLGNALVEQSQRAEAESCYRQALRLNPHYANAHNNLGSAFMHGGRHAEAVECFREALRIDPQNSLAQNNLAEAYFNLGNALKAKGQAAEAAQYFRQGLSINPEDAKVHNNLGVALSDQGQLIEAAECFREALRVNPRDVEAHSNLGITFMWLGRIEESMQHYDQALGIDPAHSMALWNRSVLRLLQGDFKGGWRDFEQRWTHADMKTRLFNRPRWDGSTSLGKTVLLYAEQGLGDTIQFLRYAPLVKQRGGSVLFECPPALLRLVGGMAVIDQLVAEGEPLPQFDAQAALLSLPGIFGTTLATIPAQVPYLRAEPGLLEYWRKELAPLNGVKIGIAWQGSVQNKDDRFRSLPLRHFETLAHIPGIRLVSLQKGHGTEQLLGHSTSPTPEFEVFDLSKRLDLKGAFTDTAAVIMNLDLVITVDTAVAHVAGALGAPTWLLLSSAPDWRWLLVRSDSPWYPTMRLFRQHRLGDWDEVFQRLAAAIRSEFAT